MTDVTRRGVLKAAGVVGAGAALTSTPSVAGAVPPARAQTTTSAANQSPPRDRKPVDLGDRLELMAGTKVIDQLDGAEFRLHQPVRREVVMTTDRPWEGSQCHYRHTFKDGDGYRMYYTALDINFSDGKIEHPHPSRVALAESTDGRTWPRPNLGLVEHDGSTDNNLVAGTGDGHTFAFKDTNPAAATDAQYKAVKVEPGFTAIQALKSEDGLAFEPLTSEPMMRSGDASEHGLTNMSFDSLNVAFWDPEIGRYRLYLRNYRDRESDGTYRNILTSTSDDFLTWTIPEPLEYPGSPEPEEQLYTNNVLPYYRAPHVLLGFPMRYIQPPGWLDSHYHLPGLRHRRERFIANERLGTAMTDSLFMCSRDGLTFDRWDEPFIAPGPGVENWKYADNSMGRGIVVTPSHIQGAPGELSFYATEGYWTGDDLDVVRYTMRVDGFVSVNAPRTGGEVITRPLWFSGEQLVLNLATSAAGQVRVEIQNPGGGPIKGFSLDESDPLFGNDLSRPVSWRRGDSDLSSLRHRPVRLRLALNDADIYSLRFRPAITFESTQAIVNGYRDRGDITSSQQQNLLTALSNAKTAAEEGKSDDALEALDQFVATAAGVSDDEAQVTLLDAGEELKRQVWVAAADWPTRYGWLYDTEPAKGNLEHVGLSTALFALDYRNRSIGAALWEPATVVKLTLRDVDGTTRLTTDDLSVYVSDTNNSDWRRLEGVEVSRTSDGFEFTGFNVTTRYVKVVQPYSDDAFTFTNQVSQMLEVTTGAP